MSLKISISQNFCSQPSSHYSFSLVSFILSHGFNSYLYMDDSQICLWRNSSRCSVQIVVWTSPYNILPRKITICLNVKSCSHSSIASYTSSLPALFLYLWLMSPAFSHHSGQKPHHPRLFSHSKCPLLLQCPISIPFSSSSWHHPPLTLLFSCYQSVSSCPATLASLGSL